MEILKYKDIEDLYWFMCDLVEHDNKNVTAVLFYDDALELMRNFIEDYDVEIGNIEIGNHDYNGYDKEYYVSIGSDYTLDVCPAMPHFKQDFGYVPVQGVDVILYHGDVKQSIVTVNDCDESFQIEFGEDSDDNCSLCSCGSCPILEYIIALLGK
jgi:hypothetical protein